MTEPTTAADPRCTEEQFVGRFVWMPPANEPPNPPLASYYCDDCCQPDYVDTYDDGDIREFYYDTERELYVCEKCMLKHEANINI